MNVTSVKRIHQSDWTDSGVRFLRARDIVAAAKNEEPDDYLYISKEKYEEYSALSGKVDVSDLLVTGVGTIGVPYLVRNLEPLYFKDGNIIWFQNSNKIDGKFLFYSFSAEQIQGFVNESAGKRGCYFNVNTTKTPAGRRKVPMLGFVKEAFLMEKERQELLDLHCEATVDGYTDFIFINRFGQPQHQATLNKAIRRIIRDCNDEQLLKDENAEVLLPHFSCHSLRHTFTTRMCEAGVNVKVIQDTLGHKDISTTLNIYTDVTKELRKSEFEGLDSYFKNEYNKVSV